MPQYHVRRHRLQGEDFLGIVNAEDHRDALSKAGVDSEKHKRVDMYLHKSLRGMIEVLDLHNGTYVFFVPI